MIIGVDVDEVCADLLTEWCRRYNEDWDDALTRDACTLWDMTKLVKPACEREIYDYLKAPDLYDRIEPIAGAVEGVRALRNAGHIVHFITSCVEGPMADAKFAWLLRHGFFHYAEHHLSENQDYYHAVTIDKAAVANQLGLDVLIDDRPENLEQMPGVVGRILFDAPHNRDRSAASIDAYRATGWEGVLPLVRMYEGSYRNAQKRVAATNQSTVTPPRLNQDLSKGGVKYDTGKPQWSLLPLKLLEGVVRVLMYGAAKYDAWNWRKGMHWTRVYDAAQRHLVAWAEREDLDPETQLNHIDHALCELIFLRGFIAEQTGVDDRFDPAMFNQKAP